jgi:hypothetical protein
MMQLNKNIIIAIILLSSMVLSAQYTDDIPRNRPFFDKKTLSWGYYFGMNFYDFKINYDQEYHYITQESLPGFQVGLVGNWNINENLSFRSEPGVYFTNRKLIFNNLLTAKDSIREITSNYVQLPFSIKLNTIRYGNIRPYITGGIIFAHNLNSWEDSHNDNEAGHFRMRTNVWMYEVGFGVEMYLFYFKFTPSIRGVFALQNELVPDNDPNSPWTGHLESIMTRGLYINLTFE